MKLFETETCNLSYEPTFDEVRQLLPTHVAIKVLRHLDWATGDASRGEFQCTGILALFWNRYVVLAIYRTKRPDGTAGTQFMLFRTFKTSARIFPVTADGRVVMIQEHRRLRGAWAQILPAGATDHDDVSETLAEEVLEETGCVLSPKSRIIEVANRFTDEGNFAERVHFLAVDGLAAPAAHTRPEEGIRGIVLVPFAEWRARARNGEYDDVCCEFFAARCNYDFPAQRVCVQGHCTTLRGDTQ